MSIIEISVEEQYLQDNSLKKEDILDLLEWVKEQNDIPDIGEKRTILFYQSCRYDKFVTKSTIRHFFEMARSSPEFFKNTDPRQPKLLKVINESFMGVLPLTTPKGHKIFLIKAINIDQKTFSLEEYFKLATMVNTLLINKHGMPAGLIPILDLKEVPFGCYPKCGIWTIKKILFFITKALPLHVVSIHFVNAPSVFNKILAIVKFFAPSEMADRFQVHSDIKALYKFIPKEIMPEDYGGNSESTLEMHGITVEELYSKDTCLKKDDIFDLLEWVEQQEDLPKIGEKRAIIFYQSCRYNKDAAKSAISHYFGMARSIPEFFKNTNPTNNSKLQLAVNEAIKAALPSTTPEGYHVLLMRNINIESKTFCLEEHIKVLYMVTLMINKNGVPPGLIVILDVKDAPFGCYPKCSVWTIKKAISFVVKAVPVHLISFHIVNAPSLLNHLIAFGKMLAPAEAAKYLHVHPNIEGLYKFVPKEIMPEDYGGNAHSVVELHARNTKEIMENTPLFVGEEELIYGNN